MVSGGEAHLTAVMRLRDMYQQSADSLYRNAALRARSQRKKHSSPRPDGGEKRILRRNCFKEGSAPWMREQDLLGRVGPSESHKCRF